MPWGMKKVEDKRRELIDAYEIGECSDDRIMQDILSKQKNSLQMVQPISFAWARGGPKGFTQSTSSPSESICG